MDATIAPTFGKRSLPALTVFRLPSWDRTVCKIRFKRFNSFRSPTVETVRSGCCGRQKADIYHVHNPENIPAGLLLKFLFRKRVVYDSREDFPAMMLNKTYLSPGLRKLAQQAVFKAERLAANYFDGFVTADAGTLRPHAKHGQSRKLVFYNLPNLEF